MKKRFITVMLSLAIAATAFSQEKFTVKGKLIEVDKTSKIYLSYMINGTRKLDSAALSNGEFTFSGTVETPVRAILEFRSAGPPNMREMFAPSSRNMQEFYIEKGLIAVTGDSLKTATIKGGKTQAEFLVLKGRLKPLEDEIAAISKPIAALFEQRDNKAIADLQNKVRPLRSKIAQIEEDFVKEFSDSYVSLDLVERRTADPASLGALYPLLSATLKNTPSGKNMGRRIASARRTDVGQPAIDFTRTTLDGESLSLSSLKGKYVLLDFWGSWCGPCRASFPHLKELHQRYKDEGFVVVGIAHERAALAQAKKTWKAAVEADGLPWVQVLNDDESLAEFDIVEAYGLSGFPTQVLIDKEGKIIARYLGVSKSLDDKLKEIFGK